MILSYFHTADSDYQNTAITVTFEPTAGSETAQVMCGNIPIIDDTVAGEPDEQFSVRLASSSPVGSFANDANESCITIFDDDDDGRFRCMYQPQYLVLLACISHLKKAHQGSNKCNAYMWLCHNSEIGTIAAV